MGGRQRTCCTRQKHFPEAPACETRAQVESRPKLQQNSAKPQDLRALAGWCVCVRVRVRVMCAECEVSPTAKGSVLCLVVNTG